MKNLLIMLIIGILFSLSAVSAADLENTSMMQTSQSNDYFSPNYSFANNHKLSSLQSEVDHAESNSTIYLNHDYRCNDNECIKINKDLTINGQGHFIDCRNKNNCRAFESVTGHVILKNIVITNCKIGSVLISGDSQYTFENCIFMDNKGYQGAAITNYAGTTLNIKDSLFQSNKATDSGGAIFTNGTLNMENCKLISNSADSAGGAIFTTKDTNIIGCELSKNYAGDSGGALRAWGNVNLVNSSLNDNAAYNSGGAVSAKNIDVLNSTCSNNKAGASGGALFAETITIKDTPDTRSKFMNNTAEIHGGAIYARTQALLAYVDFCCNNAGNGFDVYTRQWDIIFKLGVKCFIKCEDGLVEIPLEWGHFSSTYGCLQNSMY